MSHPSQADFEALVRHLRGANIDFIVVGGVAAILHGAPTSTLDLDIVPRQDPENLLHLSEALAGIDALVRDLAGRRMRPDLSELELGGQLRLTTRLGPIDVLGRLHDGRGYEELEPSTLVLADADLEIRVIDLETLISIKRSTGRAKDRLLVPILLALADELKKE
ncbi:MAG: hypothetical protein IT384_21235 [Deltaproteobacteria bacterium]|nr:hypothetical protein [Deltaproteobacteria bacterium]